MLLALLVFSNLTVNAESRYLVGADKISAESGAFVTVPIQISNNDGMMGFRLKIDFPESDLELHNISSGSVTKTGLFNTTVTDYAKTNGRFDILWSNNAEVAADGTLAVLSFKVRDNAKRGEYRIGIDYSSEDTFDGAFRDVKLTCKPIQIVIGSETDDGKQPSDPPEASGDNPVSDDYLVSVIDRLLQSRGSKELDELSEAQRQQILQEVNKEITVYDPQAKQYTDFGELAESYYSAAHREAVKQIMDSTDDSDITSVINEVLEEYKVKRFEDIPKAAQPEAAQKIKQRLTEKGADVSALEKVPDEEITAVIDDLSEQARQQSESGELTPNSGKGSTVGIGHKAIAIIVLCLAASAFGIILYVIKIKRRANHEKNE